jgi:hypothetical protein
VSLLDYATGTMPTMTGSTMTKAQQETAVGEGLAVGVLAVGVEAVTSSKVSVEFAFRRVWRDWPPRSLFGQVRADVERDSIIRILRDSEDRRGSYVAYWTFDGPEYVPVLRQDWRVEECGDAIAEGSGVPFAQWVELAEAFVTALGEDEVRRGD